MFAAAFALVRGVTTFALFRGALPRAQRGALAAFAAAQLPIVVVAAQVAADRGLVDESVAAAMIGAAMLSVLVFPLIGLKWARLRTDAVAAEPI